MLARAICLRLLEHLARAAASRTFWTAGSSRPIRIAMMAITTSSSISVKPRRARERIAPSFHGDKASKHESDEVRPGTARGGTKRPLGDVEVDLVRVLAGDLPFLL